MIQMWAGEIGVSNSLYWVPGETNVLGLCKDLTYDNDMILCF